MLQVVAEKQPTGGVLRTFVGGLPYHCDEDELWQFLEMFGQVEHMYMSRGLGGGHKGFAFVDFAASTTSSRVFGEHHFKNKVIEVKRNLLNCLVLGDIPPRISQADIQHAIESSGFSVAEIIVGDESNGLSKGTACVKLFDETLVGQIAPKGFLYVRGACLEAQAKLSKNLLRATYDISNRKKNNHKQSFQADTSHHQALTQVPAHQFDYRGFAKGIPDNLAERETHEVTQLSSSKIQFSDITSATEQKEGPEFLSVSDSGKKQKLGSPLWARSEAFRAPKRVESFDAESDMVLPDNGKVVEMIYNLRTFGRHLSDNLEYSSSPIQIPGRVNSLSGSAFSTSELGSTSQTPRKACTVSYFTFPGRD